MPFYQLSYCQHSGLMVDEANIFHRFYVNEVALLCQVILSLKLVLTNTGLGSLYHHLFHHN